MLILPTPPTDVLNLFGFPIYIYGIIMACAIFVAIIVANSFFNRHNPIRYKDVILENAVYIIFSGILGARLYYCLLNYSYYFAKPLEILDIRQGGLSIHGAVLGGVLCLIFISHKAKTSLLKLLDAISTATILGQAIGRWGNYFNSEAYGLPVKSQTWGVLIPESRRLPEYLEYSLYHPTFLYESVLDLFVFGGLAFIYFKFNRYKGVTFFSYLIIYSVIRFFIEQIRVDSALNVCSVPIAEIVSGVLFVVGIFGLVYSILNSKVKKS